MNKVLLGMIMTFVLGMTSMYAVFSFKDKLKNYLDMSTIECKGNLLGTSTNDGFYYLMSNHKPIQCKN